MTIFISLCIFLSIFFTPFDALPKDYVVNKIIDGNTVQLDTGEIVRYIGVDAPDRNHKTGESEFYARQAKAYNQKLVLLKKVKLEFDKEQKDDSGRLLAYVFVKNTFVNEELIKNGYARAKIVPPNIKYKRLFLDHEAKARQSERGLWQEKKEDTEKYYVGNKRNYMLHRPSCKQVNNIPEKNKIIFWNRSDAIRIGYIPCKACKP